MTTHPAKNIRLLKKDHYSIDSRDNNVTELMIAAYKGDIGKVKQLLNEGVELDAVDNNGFTALMFSIYKGNHIDTSEITKLLIEAGINFKINRITDLMVACYLGDIKKVKPSVEENTDLDAYDDHGRTALMFAALGCNILECIHKEIVALLLDKGANPNATTVNGRTALMFAAGIGIPEMVALLIKSGADLNAYDINNYKAFQYATARVHEIESYITEKSSISTTTAKAQLQGYITTLHLLAMAGSHIVTWTYDLFTIPYSNVHFYICPTSEVLNKVLKQYYFVSEPSDIMRYIKSTVAGTSAEIIKLDEYGVYRGGEGSDTFIINPAYEGQQDGYKLIISDFNYQNQADYLDLKQFKSITSLNDISFEQTSWSGKTAVELKTKVDDKTIVILLNQTQENLATENFLISLGSNSPQLAAELGSMACHVDERSEYQLLEENVPIEHHLIGAYKDQDEL
jgi:hypothetical protein